MTPKRFKIFTSSKHFDADCDAPTNDADSCRQIRGTFRIQNTSSQATANAILIAPRIGLIVPLH